MAAPAAVASRRAVFHSLTVDRVDRLCADACAVTFAVPSSLASEFAFAPGQYLTLRRFVGSVEERRSYSICAPAGGPLRIGVRLVPDGLFSAWLTSQVRPGDEVDVLPPQGSFTPSLSSSDHHCLIAAGSGITPVLSIVSSVLAASGSSRVTLLYGNRRTDTVMFADEIAELKDRYPSRLQLVHVLSREPREIDLFSGRLDAARLDALLSSVVPLSRIDHWWLCGPFGLVQDARAVLSSRSVPPERVHTELFYVDEPPPELIREEPILSGETSSVTVILDGRATTLDLPRGTPLLDAAQRVRSDLPFACKGGVCGTCRARVVDGEVHMRRNFALEAAELDAGFVLTCQSLPTTSTLTINYDT